MDLWVRAAEKRAEEAWVLAKSYQESNDKVQVKLLLLVKEVLTCIIGYGQPA